MMDGMEWNIDSSGHDGAGGGAAWLWMDADQARGPAGRIRTNGGGGSVTFHISLLISTHAQVIMGSE